MTVMVFGVFDGLHAGHRYFLKQTKATVVVVAPDLAVQQLKHKKLRYDEQERMAAVRAFLPEAQVVLGDEEQGSYEVVRKYQPDLVVLGYDQDELGRDLARVFPDLSTVSVGKLPEMA